MTDPKPLLAQLDAIDVLALKDALTFAILNEGHITRADTDLDMPEELRLTEDYVDEHQLATWHRLADYLAGLGSIMPTPLGDREEILRMIRYHRDGGSPPPQG